MAGSQVALCRQEQRSWQEAPNLPGGHSAGHGAAELLSTAGITGTAWEPRSQWLGAGLSTRGYLTRRIRRSIPAHTSRSHRPCHRSPRCGRSSAAGSPARSDAAHNLRAQGPEISEISEKSVPAQELPPAPMHDPHLPRSQVGPALPGGHTQSPVTGWQGTPTPQGHSPAQSWP